MTCTLTLYSIAEKLVRGDTFALLDSNRFRVILRILNGMLEILQFFIRFLPYLFTLNELFY